MLKYIALLLVMLPLALAGQTIITDRPDQTESSSTIDPGHVQIESGLLIGFTESNGQRHRQILAPTNLFRIGISRTFELRLLSQYELSKNQNTDQSISGVSDIEVGTKIQFLRRDDINTEIAFLSHLILPTGSSALTNDEYGVINKLSIAHEINDQMGLGYNIGYDNFGSGDGNLTYSLALGFSVNDWCGLYVEPFGAIVEFEDHEASFDAGITLLPQENIQLDFSFGTGINHTMNYISVGVSWEIKN